MRLTFHKELHVTWNFLSKEIYLTLHLRANIHLVKKCVYSADRLYTACLCDNVMSPSSWCSCFSARSGWCSLLSVWSDVTDFWFVKNSSASSICQSIRCSTLKPAYQGMGCALHDEYTACKYTLLKDLLTSSEVYNGWDTCCFHSINHL